MNRKFFWIAYLIGLFLGIGGIYLVINKFKKTSAPNISTEKIQLENLDGTTISLEKYLTKPLVVNYWATWCAPCKNEFNDFEKIKQEFGNKVTFVMISDEAKSKILLFKQQNPYTFLFLHSVKSLNEYGINILPTTYFYNSKGTLKSKHIGKLDAKELKEILETITE